MFCSENGVTAKTRTKLARKLGYASFMQKKNLIKYYQRKLGKKYPGSTSAYGTFFDGNDGKVFSEVGPKRAKELLKKNETIVYIRPSQKRNCCPSQNIVVNGTATDVDEISIDNIDDQIHGSSSFFYDPAKETAKILGDGEHFPALVWLNLEGYDKSDSHLILFSLLPMEDRKIFRRWLIAQK